MSKVSIEIYRGDSGMTYTNFCELSNRKPIKARVLVSGQGTSMKERVRRVFEREDCECRDVYGECLKVGGSCLVVDDKYCIKKKLNLNYGGVKRINEKDI